MPLSAYKKMTCIKNIIFKAVPILSKFSIEQIFFSPEKIMAE